MDTAKSVLGQTTGKGAYNEKEAWWWNEEVQKAVKEKRLKVKQYQQSRCDEDKDDFREANKRVKREVAKAKESAYKDLYDKLDSIDGQKMIYKLSTLECLINVPVRVFISRKMPPYMGLIWHYTFILKKKKFFFFFFYI